MCIQSFTVTTLYTQLSVHSLTIILILKIFSWCFFEIHYRTEAVDARIFWRRLYSAQLQTTCSVQHSRTISGFVYVLTADTNEANISLDLTEQFWHSMRSCLPWQAVENKSSFVPCSPRLVSHMANWTHNNQPVRTGNKEGKMIWQIKPFFDTHQRVCMWTQIDRGVHDHYHFQNNDKMTNLNHI